MDKQQGPTVVYPYKLFEYVYMHSIYRVYKYSTGNYIWYTVINHMEKNMKNNVLYICTTESLCCIADINTSL